MNDELDAALDALTGAAREHLERVRAAAGRVDDEAVWTAYVALNNAACRYDELLRTGFDEVTPFDVEPLEPGDRDVAWSGPDSADAAYEPDAEPTVISVRHRRDYLVPSAAALERAAEHARSQVPDPEADDEPVRGVGDAVLELLHSGDGTMRSLEVPELTPLDGIVVVNDVVEGMDVGEIEDGGENQAFRAGASEPVVGRLDERSFFADDQPDSADGREDD